MERFWKLALASTGLAGLGAFVFFSLYKQWLTLSVFSQMSPDQTFVLMLIFLIATFLSLVSFLISHNSTKRAELGRLPLSPGIGAIDLARPQLVRWGPVDGLEPGMTIIDGDSTFISWTDLRPEIEKCILPQVSHDARNSKITLGDFEGRENWYVEIITEEKMLVAHIWFGPDPLKNWSFDGLVRVGVPRNPSIIWNVFQRFSDGSYRSVPLKGDSA